MAFDVYEMLLNKERSNVKLSNYVIAKRVGLVVKRKEETLKEQAMTVADERRTISVAVTRKKKMAVDAIRNVAEGKFGQKEEKTMVRTLAEINADKKALAEEEKKALKAHKKDAVATVKRLIVEYNLTKGDLRGKAMKQLDGDA